MRKKTFDRIVEALVYEANANYSKVEFKQFKPDELRIETDDTYELKYGDTTVSVEYNQTDIDKVRANRKSITLPLSSRMVSIFVTDNSNKDFVINKEFFITENKLDNNKGYRMHFSTYINVDTPTGRKRILSNANQVLWINNGTSSFTETKTMFHRTSISIWKIINGGFSK